MRARYGPLYRAAVLRPIAEQVLGALDAQPGETVCDLVCDAGALTLGLAGAVGRSGTVFALDVQATLAAAAADGASGASRALAREASAGRAPIDDHACDRVASLLTLGFAPGLFGEAHRIAKADGRVVIAMWDPESPPAHEDALRSALATVVGAPSLFIDSVLAKPPARALVHARIRDVLRFDGVAHLWMALVDERPFAAELEPLPQRLITAVRDAVARRLSEHTAPDGTLRIPVDVLLLA